MVESRENVYLPSMSDAAISSIWTKIDGEISQVRQETDAQLKSLFYFLYLLIAILLCLSLTKVCSLIQLCQLTRNTDQGKKKKKVGTKIEKDVEV